jgi:hypothetical protein
MDSYSNRSYVKLGTQVLLCRPDGGTIDLVLLKINSVQQIHYWFLLYTTFCARVITIVSYDGERMSID